jgi:hypothetical protein
MEIHPGFGLNRKHLACFVLVGAVLFGKTAKAGSDPVWAISEEMVLPNYLQSALQEHQPLVDMMPSGDHGLWLISSGSLWLWRFDAKGLTHINLNQGDATAAPLQKLGTDGTAIFAASAHSLFQMIWPDRRVFRYALPRGTHDATLGFAGSGDEFRIIHTRGIISFDRYGKNVKLVQPLKSLQWDDQISYHPGTGILWRLKGKLLEQADTSQADPKFRMLMKTHNPMMNLALDGSGAVVNTPYAVLRIGSRGKMLRSIPVEGRRQLIGTYITPEVHAYLFSDQIVEIYRPIKRSAFRTKVDLSSEEKVKKITVEQEYISILTENGVRAFRMKIH